MHSLTLLTLQSRLETSAGGKAVDRSTLSKVSTTFNILAAASITVFDSASATRHPRQRDCGQNLWCIICGEHANWYPVTCKRLGL